ncbi:acyl carrier protein [Chloroflexota bacterium]
MDIYTQLSEYICTEILKHPGKNLDGKEALISSGLIDSFSLVDLSLFVEENFGVRIDDTELNAETFDNLEQLTKLVEERR